jgi:hypothetical protein
MILAIDPGPEQSALVVWDGTSLLEKMYADNLLVLYRLKQAENDSPLVIEQIASYGMSVGQSVFETCYWSGRFAEAYGAARVHRVPRLQVKMHLCHDSRAKDGNIRQALLDRFGGKEKAIGKKASRGPLYGVSGDIWAALALAITFWDQHSAARVTNREESVMNHLLQEARAIAARDDFRSRLERMRAEAEPPPRSKDTTPTEPKTAAEIVQMIHEHYSADDVHPGLGFVKSVSSDGHGTLILHARSWRPARPQIGINKAD